VAGGALAQGSQLPSSAVRSPSSERRLGAGLELLLPLADHAPLLHQPPAARLLLDGATRDLGLDLAVLRLRRGTVGPGRVAFSGGELGPELHLGPLLMRLDPAGGGIAQPLGRVLAVAVEGDPGGLL
jgi:hypothetical protein